MAVLYPTTAKFWALGRRNSEGKWAIMNAHSLYCYPPVNIRLFGSRDKALDEIRYQGRTTQANAQAFEVTVTWTEPEKEIME